MFKKLFLLMVVLLFANSNYLLAEIEYEIHDIDTLQTHSSEAIALNNQGQILGWYNVDGSPQGKCFFVRDNDGVFFELPKRDNKTGWEINWKYLKNDGKAYGIFQRRLYRWDQKNGVVTLGDLPEMEISAINDNGQVLIKSISDNENGKSIRRPAIWDNGKIIKLKRLEGDLGIESEESYGLDLNNKGEVVGYSVVHVSYKNKLYKQTHATKWENGENGRVIDLHQKVPKSSDSYTIAINDHGEILMFSGKTKHQPKHLIKNDDNSTIFSYDINKLNNAGYVYNYDNDNDNEFPVKDVRFTMIDRNGQELCHSGLIKSKIQKDTNSIWMTINKVVQVNDKGEIIAQGETIYGEQHAMFLSPVKIVDYQETNSIQEMILVENLEEKEEILDEEQLRFNKLIDFVISEIEYNMQQEVVNRRGYRVDALKSLYYYSGKYYLTDDIREGINESICFILRCKTSTLYTSEEAKKCNIELKNMVQELKKV